MEFSSNSGRRASECMVTSFAWVFLVFQEAHSMKTVLPFPATFHPERHLEVLDVQNRNRRQADEQIPEPAVCSDCGAVYHQGHWQWITSPAHAIQTRCPACRRIAEHMPAGYVSIEGAFAQGHRNELVNLARHQEALDKAEHPLQRIISIEDQDGTLLVTTTDVHLARDIGNALHEAYQGNLSFYYNNNEYLLRVHWRH